MSRIAYVAASTCRIARRRCISRTAATSSPTASMRSSPCVAGHLVDEEPHLKRLHRSLGELRIAMPMADAALKIVLREVIRRNGVDTGIVYLQVTRGAAPREHAFPKSAKPTLVVTSRRAARPTRGSAMTGSRSSRSRTSAGSAATSSRWRWSPTCSASSRRARPAPIEAWQVDGEGRVTEGTSTNAWIVTADDTVVTRAADHAILNGVTRLAVFDIIAREGYRLVERPFTVEEARGAREAFLTSTTADLLPVVRLDGEPIGDGKPGPLSRKLRAAYLAHAAAAA